MRAAWRWAPIGKKGGPVLRSAKFLCSGLRYGEGEDTAVMVCYEWKGIPMGLGE